MNTPTSEEDQALWAARIRAHFEPHLRDTAERVALIFADALGPRLKQLRPETRMSELEGWVKESGSSLDWVEIIMGIEEEAEAEIPDEYAEHLEERTFREFVTYLHSRRAV